MKTLILIALISFVTLNGCIRKVDKPTLADNLPSMAELSNWSAADTVRTFVGEDLFVLINGGAELYHANGFDEVVTQTFTNKSGNQISIEIFRMKSTEGAKVVYQTKVSPAGEKLPLGDEAMLNSYYLNLRQGRHIVTLVGYDSDSATITGLKEIAAVLTTKIK